VKLLDLCKEMERLLAEKTDDLKRVAVRPKRISYLNLGCV